MRESKSHPISFAEADERMALVEILREGRDAIGHILATLGHEFSETALAQDREFVQALDQAIDYLEPFN